MNLTITGLPRSGSTLIWQIINEISIIRGIDIKISKEHGDTNYMNNNIIILTYRDIRDVIISLVNSHYGSSKYDDKSFDEKINMVIHENWFNDYLEGFLKLYNGGNHSNKIIPVRYEDFLPNNVDKLTLFLFNQIKNHYKLKELNNIELDKIVKKFSIENNMKISEELKDFQKYDSTTLIHGNHITSNGSSNNWSSVTFNGEAKEIINKFLIKLNGNK